METLEGGNPVFYLEIFLLIGGPSIVLAGPMIRASSIGIMGIRVDHFGDKYSTETPLEESFIMIPSVDIADTRALVFNKEMGWLEPGP